MLLFAPLFALGGVGLTALVKSRDRFRTARFLLAAMYSFESVFYVWQCSKSQDHPRPHSYFDYIWATARKQVYWTLWFGQLLIIYPLGYFLHALYVYANYP